MCDLLALPNSFYHLFFANARFLFHYPSATSSIIIITNPIQNPIVPMLECFPVDASGINSSTTTYNIAPAANASKYGSINIMASAKTIVNAAATGSTTPDNVPYKNAFPLPFPSERNGSETMAPSGKFCIAIPNDNAIAEDNVM